MTNNQLKKAFNFCFLMKNESINEEVNNIIKNYNLDKIIYEDDHYVCDFSNSNGNSLNMIISNDNIHITKFENGIFSNIAIYDTQVMRQTNIEKREKGLIYTEICKRFGKSRRFNNQSVLTDLEEERYVFSEDSINTILENDDFSEVDPIQIFIRLKNLSMKANLEDAADLFTTFSTHMNYYYSWIGGREITDNFYPTKTLINGENVSCLFDVTDDADKLYRVYDLYNGVINPRNEIDIKAINLGFIPDEAFDYKRFIGITENENEIVGNPSEKLSTDYVSYLKDFFKKAFGYTGDVELDRLSLLSAINYKFISIERIKKDIEKRLGISYEEFELLDLDEQHMLIEKVTGKKLKPNYKLHINGIPMDDEHILTSEKINRRMEEITENRPKNFFMKLFRRKY